MYISANTLGERHAKVASYELSIITSDYDQHTALFKIWVHLPQQAPIEARGIDLHDTYLDPLRIEDLRNWVR